MIARTRTSRRNRRHVQPSQTPTAGNANATATIVATNVQVDFDVPVAVVAAIAGFADWKVQGASPIGIVVNSPTRLTLDYTASVVATNVMLIPANSSAVRTSTGGFVNAKSTTF